MQFIIAYDICDPRRLSRVARRLEKDALRLQKSVFWIDCSFEEVGKVLDCAAEVIDSEVDCIQAWRLHGRETARGQVRGMAMPVQPTAAILGAGVPQFVAKAEQLRHTEVKTRRPK